MCNKSLNFPFLLLFLLSGCTPSSLCKFGPDSASFRPLESLDLSEFELPPLEEGETISLDILLQNLDDGREVTHTISLEGDFLSGLTLDTEGESVVDGGVIIPDASEIANNDAGVDNSCGFSSAFSLQLIAPESIYIEGVTDTDAVIYLQARTPSSVTEEAWGIWRVECGWGGIQI